MRYLKLTLIICLLTLISCNTMQASRTSARARHLSWTQQQKRNNQLTVWNATGGIAMRLHQEGWSGMVQWYQREGRYALNFIAPMGAGSARIASMGKQVTLTASDGKKVTADNPEALVLDAIGWYVPVSNMYYWIRGLPAPGHVTKMVLDDKNRLMTLEQDGWHVEFKGYRRFGHYDLPRRLRLAKAPLQIKILIKKWDKPGHGN